MSIDKHSDQKRRLTSKVKLCNNSNIFTRHDIVLIDWRMKDYEQLNFSFIVTLLLIITINVAMYDDYYHSKTSATRTHLHNKYRFLFFFSDYATNVKLFAQQSVTVWRSTFYCCWCYYFYCKYCIRYTLCIKLWYCSGL